MTPNALYRSGLTARLFHHFEVDGRIPAHVFQQIAAVRARLRRAERAQGLHSGRNQARHMLEHQQHPYHDLGWQLEHLHVVAHIVAIAKDAKRRRNREAWEQLAVEIVFAD